MTNKCRENVKPSGLYKRQSQNFKSMWIKLKVGEHVNTDGRCRQLAEQSDTRGGKRVHLFLQKEFMIYIFGSKTLYIITQATMLQLLPASLNFACIVGARRQFWSIKCLVVLRLACLLTESHVVWPLPFLPKTAKQSQSWKNSCAVKMGRLQLRTSLKIMSVD